MTAEGESTFRNDRASFSKLQNIKRRKIKIKLCNGAWRGRGRCRLAVTRPKDNLTTSQTGCKFPNNSAPSMPQQNSERKYIRPCAYFICALADTNCYSNKMVAIKLNHVIQKEQIISYELLN